MPVNIQQQQQSQNRPYHPRIGTHGAFQENRTAKCIACPETTPSTNVMVLLICQQRRRKDSLKEINCAAIVFEGDILYANAVLRAAVKMWIQTPQTVMHQPYSVSRKIISGCSNQFKQSKTRTRRITNHVQSPNCTKCTSRSFWNYKLQLTNARTHQGNSRYGSNYSSR